MFYAHFVLAKKGPLAKIWLAAHFDKKLTKAHVFETNIQSSVEGILQPKVKMALRTSGHLLLGIVRIYSRKAKYLLADCNEAFIKIKMAFRPGIVDLPEGHREAAVSSITLPEIFHDFECGTHDMDLDMDAQVQLNQSRIEDITLKEDYGGINLVADDGFGDMTFDDPDGAKDATNIDEGFDHAALLLCGITPPGMQLPKEPDVNNATNEENSRESGGSNIENRQMSLDQVRDDGFGATVGEGLFDSAGDLFEPAGLFHDAPYVCGEPVGLGNTNLPPKPNEEQSSDDDDVYDGMDPGSIGGSSPPSSPEPPPAAPNTEVEKPKQNERNLDGASNNASIEMPHSMSDECDSTNILGTVPNDICPPGNEPPVQQEEPPEESFALQPLDGGPLGTERGKTKRKRKLIVDEVKNISGEEMKNQLSDTTDIVVTLDLAPPTKKLMQWKETGGVEKLFALPGNPILSRILARAYQRHLTTRSAENEDFGLEDRDFVLDLEFERGRDERDSDVIERAHKRRRELEPAIPQDLSHLEPMRLDTSRPPYPSDHGLSHASLEVSNFLEQSQHHSHMFPQQIPDQSQQMMQPVMQPVVPHPPPAHMIHQMLQSEVNQLSHLPPQMLHPHPSMMDQSHPLHNMPPGMHDVHSPVSKAYNQGVPLPQHLLPEPMPPIQDHMQPPTTVDKPLPNQSPINEQLNQLPPHPAVDHLGNLHHTDEQILQANIDDQVLQPPVDDDITQPCLGEQHGERNTTEMEQPVPEAPCGDDLLNQNIDQQNISAQTEQQNSDANLLFDVLNGAIEDGPAPQVNANEEDQQKDKNHNQEFPLSDDDDYGAPASVGPILPDEQMADETYEQFEERILAKRTTHMLHLIHSKLEIGKGMISFAELVRNNKRKQVAEKFYTFLVLKKQRAVELEQATSYGDMIISKGSKFTAIYNGN